MIGWLQSGMPHLIVAPILLPLLTAVLMLLLGERRHWKALVNVVSSGLGLLIAIALLERVDSFGVPAAIGIYLPSNWDVPFGIVLAVDRLSALMLVLSGVISLCCVLFSIARWDRAGVHFHPLLQIQLMGLNGAFLTGDLFNLFVFFEVLLAASYGLLLHGSGRARVQAGLHYIAINLLASSLFLIGVSMLYGVTGTLNMADLAQKIPQVAAADRGLLHAAAGILAIAFLTKAAMWPLNFWLVPAYVAASAPVAALFAIMTKVGVYTVLRLWTLLFSAQAGDSALFGAEVLIYGGLATLAFGALGMLASQQLGRLASFSAIVSAGTLLAAVGFGQATLTAGALFYLLSSTLAISALFLLVELIERSRQAQAVLLADEADELPLPPEPLQPDARREPRRRATRSDRQSHSGRRVFPGLELHRLCIVDRRSAAVVRLSGQVRHAVGIAQSAWPGHRVCGDTDHGRRLDTAGADHRLGPAVDDRVVALGHPLPLGAPGSAGTASARRRMLADRRTARGLRSCSPCAPTR